MGLPPPLAGAAALLALACGLGLLVSPDPAASLPHFWSLLFGLALFCGLGRSLGTPRAARRAAGLLAAAGAGLALLALVAAGWGQVRLLPLPFYAGLPALLRDPADGRLLHPRIVGLALAALLPAPLLGAAAAGPLRRRAPAALAALLVAAVLALTQSIPGAFGAAAALLALAAVRRRRALLALPLAAGLAAAALWARGPRAVAGALLAVDHPLGVALLLRWDMAARALDMLRDLPLTGIGLDRFAQVQAGFYPGFLLGPEPHAHNLYLQAALDLGLPGLAALLFLVAAAGAGLLRALPRLGPEARRAGLGAGAGLLALLAAGLLDTAWTSKAGPLLWALLGVVAGVTAARPGAGDGPPPGRAARLRRWAVPAGLLALLALGLALRPGAAALDRALVRAHRALSAGAAGPAAAARLAGSLDRALARAPGTPAAYRTLGRLYAAAGDEARALDALARGVAADLRGPAGRYAPWVAWQRRLLGAAPAEPWRDLLDAYAAWMVRYPQRAEHYLQAARVWAGPGGDAARARAVLEAGLAAGAAPAGLLRATLAEWP